MPGRLPSCSVFTLTGSRRCQRDLGDTIPSSLGSCGATWRAVALLWGVFPLQPDRGLRSAEVFLCADLSVEAEIGRRVGRVRAMPGSRHPPQVAAWWPGAPGGAWEVLHDLASGDGMLSVCSCWRWHPHWCVLTPGLMAAVTAGVGASACLECSLPHGGRRGERGPGHWAELSRVGLAFSWSSHEASSEMCAGERRQWREAGCWRLELFPDTQS